MEQPLSPDQSIDRFAFRKMGYGLYIVSSVLEGKPNGQIANTVFQVTSDPPRIAASISHSNLTHEYITQSGLFSVSILLETAPLTFIGLFGFRSGRVIDKFAQAGHKISPAGCPIVIEHAAAVIEAKVINKIDAGSHTIFLGDVIRAEVVSESPAMSYAYYHQNLRGKTPKDSPTYIPIVPVK